jgi:hypothetical protein
MCSELAHLLLNGLLSIVLCLQANLAIRVSYGEELSSGDPVLKLGELNVSKVLVLGNSVALHGPAPEIGWHGDWGMAASRRESDFAHVLLALLTKATGREPKLLVKNIADFERQQTDYDFAAGLKEALDFRADLVIVAVGANAPPLESSESVVRFRTAFDRLLKELKRDRSPVIFVRGEFWPIQAKELQMREACENAGAVFIPLEDLDKDPLNLGSADRKYEHAGVGGHPGDRGMQLIAEAIWDAIKLRSQ